MEQNHLPDDLIATSFRSLSQHRRQGVLEITDSRSKLEISFQDGKIVAARKPDENLALAVCQRLCNAGLLPREAIEIYRQLDLNLDQLTNRLRDEYKICSDSVKQALSAHEFDLLCTVRDLKSPKVNFSPKVFSQTAIFNLSVFPGQLLLDIADQLEEEQRLKVLFGGNDQSVYLKAKTTSNISRLNIAEKSLLSSLTNSKSIAEVMVDNLLSAQQSVKAILSLYDQDFIELLDKQEIAVDDSKLVQTTHSDSLELSGSEVQSIENTVGKEMEQAKLNVTGSSNISEKLSALNFYLLSDNVLTKIVAVVVIAYFGLLALYLPEQLNQLFLSLNSFSSL